MPLCFRNAHRGCDHRAVCCVLVVACNRHKVAEHEGPGGLCRPDQATMCFMCFSGMRLHTWALLRASARDTGCCQLEGSGGGCAAFASCVYDKTIPAFDADANSSAIASMLSLRASFDKLVSHEHTVSSCMIPTLLQAITLSNTCVNCLVYEYMKYVYVQYALHVTFGPRKGLFAAFESSFNSWS
jgi:hypothetical protein